MKNYLVYIFLGISVILNTVQFYVINDKQSSEEKMKFSDNSTLAEIETMPTEEKTKILTKKLDEANKKEESEVKKIQDDFTKASQKDTNLIDPQMKSGYAIIVGAFKTKHFIEKNEKAITDLGYKVLKQEALINKKKLTVLMVGLFKDQKMAQITMDVLKEDKAIGYKAFLKKIHFLK